MDPIKLAGIRDWPSPTTVKQTRSFLGFGNYYRRFISGFTEIARPLHELTKKDKIWNWTNECQTAFETLKERFSTAPVLTMPDTTKPFILETDASKWAIGATLLQKQEDGQLHPCGYLSHALTQTERNWQIYDRELYAIIYALDEWKYLLLGGEHTLTIHCDHKNLTYYRMPQRLTARQARWWTNLSRYNYQLIHIPGAKLIQADALSRRPDHTKGEEDDELVTMLPKEQFISLIATDLRDQIQTLSSNNDFIKGRIKCLKERSTPPLRTALSNWTLDDGIILFKNKVFVPNNKDIRRSIIAETHESPVSGHPGHLKTLYLLKERFYWPGMAIMTKQFIDGCAVYQQMKTNTHPTAAPLMPIKSHAHRPFQQVTMDFITDLPISNGFDSIFIVVDQGLSKGVILCPCNKTIDAEGTIKLYIDKALPEVSEKTNSPVANDRINQLYKSREEALAAHDLARVKMMERTTNRTKPFKVNDQVWLESKNLRIPYQSRKLAPKREGPFKIKEVLGPVTYRLTLPKQWKIHDVFHACLLTPYKETELHGPNETRPPPDLVEGQEEYKIEAIISHRLHKNRETTYLIKWKGYNSSENSWIPESELTNAEEELNAYKEHSNLQ
jgi:hypothetical protein